MGLSLAGASRLKEEPIHSIPGSSALAIEGHEQLSISDRALLRKYGLSGQQQETTREPEAHHGTIPIVRRVDGHPPQADLNLYDRMLLRKYSVSATASMPSDCSSLYSIPPTSPPVESTKKRRRFFKKGKLSRDIKREVGQVQEGSPCGFSSQVAEPPVRAGTSISHSASSPEPSHFTLLHHTLVRDGALPLGYVQEFTSLEAPARRSANRLQASAIAVTDSTASMTLAALRRESEHRASVEKSILDQLVIAADMRLKRFRTKWQRIVYDGPTARKDAESAERDRWIQLLANLLRSTDTPMGKLIRENPSNVQLLGGGRRAGTLRSRVRSVQKVSRLAGRVPRCHLSDPLEAVDRILASSVFRTLCQRIAETCPFLIHLLAGGGWDRGQAHGFFDVCCCVEGTYVTSDSWKASPPGSTVPNYFTCGV